jgi:Zn-finger nucleic acid-binding protein
MHCPSCIVELNITDRQGVEIDYCPQCRGVWLNRGELDKIIERTMASTASRSRDDDDEPYGRRERYEEERYRHRGRRRKSFLEDLFDFD